MYATPYLIHSIPVVSKLISPNSKMSEMVSDSNFILGLFPFGVPSYQDIWQPKGYDDQQPGNHTFLASDASGPGRFGDVLIADLVAQLADPTMTAHVARFAGRDIIVTFNGRISKGALATILSADEAPEFYADRTRLIALRKTSSVGRFDDTSLLKTGQKLASYTGAPNQNPGAVVLPDVAWDPELDILPGDIIMATNDVYFTGDIQLWLMPNRNLYPAPSQSYHLFGTQSVFKLWKSLTNVSLRQPSDMDVWKTQVSASLARLANGGLKNFPSEVFPDDSSAACALTQNVTAVVLTLIGEDATIQLKDASTTWGQFTLGRVGDAPTLLTVEIDSVGTYLEVNFIPMIKSMFKPKGMSSQYPSNPGMVNTMTGAGTSHLSVLVNDDLRESLRYGDVILLKDIACEGPDVEQSWISTWATGF